MAQAITGRKTWTTVLAWGALALIAAMVLTHLLHDTLFPGRPLTASPIAETQAAPVDTAATATTVTLPEGKWKRAGIATGPAEVTTLAAEIGVPGRIEANTDRRIEIRPRATGVVREVKVVLGQKVKPGDELVVLDSPDVGAARLTLRGRQRALFTARTEASWKNEVAANVARLIPELRAGVPARTVAAEYADRLLGSYRAVLIQAYTGLELASHEAVKQTGLHRDRIVGEHPALVAVHTREGAQAKFESELEQVRFDAKQQTLIADQQVKHAEAAVIEAAQRLRILGVPVDIDALLAHPEDAVGGSTDDDVTTYTIVAPFEGTILSRDAVPSQMAERADVLFTLADLSTVWVVANVHESDFSSLHALRGGTVQMTTNAYPDRSFGARLLSIGAMVEPTTRTVPILAETPNPDDMFKLGMFVRIALTGATSEELLTVPAAAVVEIDGRKGVFLPVGKDGRTYTFHPVKVGRASGDRQVVLSGLSGGEPVVSSGAFFLKSELILQNEAEDD